MVRSSMDFWGHFSYIGSPPSTNLVPLDDGFQMKTFEEYEDENLSDEARIESDDKQRSDAWTQKKLMQALVEFKSFLVLSELLEKQMEARIHEMLVMPQGHDDMVRRTYSAGEIAGIKIALNLPRLLIDGAQATLDLLNAKEKDNG